MVDPLSYFSFQPVLHDWCNKECGMCYPVCGMVHIKEPLLLIGKSGPCIGGSGFQGPINPPLGQPKNKQRQKQKQKQKKERKRKSKDCFLHKKHQTFA